MYMYNILYRSTQCDCIELLLSTAVCCTVLLTAVQAGAVASPSSTRCCAPPGSIYIDMYINTYSPLTYHHPDRRCSCCLYYHTIVL